MSTIPEPEPVTAGAEQIAAQVRRVAELRRRQAEVDTKIKSERAAFEERIKHLTEEAKQLDCDCASAEDFLREIALAHYKQTKETSPTAGVQVKFYKQLEYDPEKADKWTREMGLARIPERLNRTAFEKIARATAIDFVVVKKVPRTTISQDLEKVLSEAIQ